MEHFKFAVLLLNLLYHDLPLIWKKIKLLISITGESTEEGILFCIVIYNLSFVLVFRELIEYACTCHNINILKVTSFWLVKQMRYENWL